jgi:hypothetical protein
LVSDEIPRSARDWTLFCSGVKRKRHCGPWPPYYLGKQGLNEAKSRSFPGQMVDFTCDPSRKDQERMFHSPDLLSNT